MHRLLVLLIVISPIAIPLSACRSGEPESMPRFFTEPQLTRQKSGTDALLIGISVVNESVVWLSGTGGTFLRTTDGGTTWEAGIVPGADTLQFRDVHAVSADTAYLLSIGPGTASRVYQTENGGRTWAQRFVSGRLDTFFDCFDFWPDGSAIGFSDEVDGRIPIIQSNDGRSWHIEDGPEALEEEGGFAASGTCLVTLGENVVLIGTGNTSAARVLRSSDGGQNWTATATPIVSGEGAGITTLAFRDDLHGAALGGHLTDRDSTFTRVAVTADGGMSWTAAGQPSFSGPVYGSAYVPGTRLLVAVGPNGASYSPDDGSSWVSLDTLNYWSVAFASERAGWAVGTEGRITRISFGQP